MHGARVHGAFGVCEVGGRRRVHGDQGGHPREHELARRYLEVAVGQGDPAVISQVATPAVSMDAPAMVRPRASRTARWSISAELTATPYGMAGPR